MGEQRKPLASLLGFVEQVIDATGRRQEFDEAPCLHLVVQNNSGQETLHVRIYPGTSQASRVIELGIYEVFSREHRWTMRMDGGGLPIDEVHGEPVPQHIEKSAIRKLLCLGML
jgi:hypothetical protein